MEITILAHISRLFSLPASNDKRITKQQFNTVKANTITSTPKISLGKSAICIPFFEINFDRIYITFPRTKLLHQSSDFGSNNRKSPARFASPGCLNIEQLMPKVCLGRNYFDVCIVSALIFCTDFACPTAASVLVFHDRIHLVCLVAELNMIRSISPARS